MNYDKIVTILKEKAANNNGNGLNFDDYIDVLKDKEVKEFLDKKFEGIEEINENSITNKNYLLKELLEIYCMENDIEIIDDDVEKDTRYIDTLGIYFSDIHHYSILKRDEEVELFTKYNETKDPELRKEIVNHNLRMVVNIAKKYSRFSEEGFKDAIQDGNEGLLTAVEKFDVTKGNKFSTFAHWWISQSIRRNYINYNRTVRLPVHFTERMNKMYYYIKEYNTLYGKDPTDQYLADKLNLPIEKIYELKNNSLDVVSYNIPVGETDHGEESTLMDFIEDNNINHNVEAKILLNSLKEEIQKTLDNELRPREKEIISLRYGLQDGTPRTLEEVGQRFNVTRERIRQIEASTLKKIRRRRRDLEEFIR